MIANIKLCLTKYIQKFNNNNNNNRPMIQNNNSNLV